MWSEYIINTCWELFVEIYGTMWSEYIINICWELLVDIYANNFQQVLIIYSDHIVP
jgi:hypothetical protein